MARARRASPFLRRILVDAPAQGLDEMSDYDMACAGIVGQYYLMYFGFRQPRFWRLTLPSEGAFRIEVIDTWEMTIGVLEGTFSGRCELQLPGKPYVALQVVRVN